MKKLIASLAILAALFNPNTSKADDSNINFKGSYQENGRYELNLGTQLKFDNFSPYVDLKLDKISQNYGLGLKLEGIGEMNGGLLNSNSQKSTEKQSNYDTTKSITNGTSRNWGTSTENETLEEKASGYKFGGKAEVGDNTFRLNVQYSNSSRTDTSTSKVTNVTRDYYNEETNQTTPVAIDTETNTTTDVNVKTNVVAETKQNDNSLRFGLEFGDRNSFSVAPYWFYNSTAVNSIVTSSINQNNSTTGTVNITINSVPQTPVNINTTSLTNYSSTQEQKQEILQNIVGTRINWINNDFVSFIDAGYNDYSKKIDYSVSIISKILSPNRISFKNQDGKQSYSIEFTDGKFAYHNIANLEKSLNDMDDSVIYDSSKKQQLTRIIEDNSLAKRDWRVKLDYDTDFSVKAYLNPIEIGYANKDQTISGKFIDGDTSISASYSNKTNKIGGDITYSFQ